MKQVQWTILIISAFTDLLVTTGTAVTASMVTNGQAVMPSKAVLLVAGIGGIVAAARTIQQALKASMGAPIAGG